MCKLICLFAILFFCFSYAPAEEITLVGDEFCPYQCKSGTDYEGLLVDAARAIFQPEGYAVIYKSMPFARALKQARQGDFIGLVGTIPAESGDFRYPEEEGAVVKMCFYVRADSSWRFTNIESLHAVRFGAVLYYGYAGLHPELGNYIENKDNEKMIQWVGGDTANLTNFRKIAVDRIDATLVDSNVAAYWLKLGGLSEQISEAGCIDVQTPLYIAFSPANPNAPKYAQIYDNGLRELRKSGKFREILAKYGMKDWK